MKIWIVKRRWADVPEAERIDEAFLLTRVGAQTPGWVEHKLQRSALAKCNAATQWTGELRWKRCPLPTAPGEEFCSRHGGAPLPTPIKAQPDPQILLARLTVRRESWVRRRRQADAAIAALDIQMQAVRSNDD